MKRTVAICLALFFWPAAGLAQSELEQQETMAIMQLRSCIRGTLPMLYLDGVYGLDQTELYVKRRCAVPFGQWLSVMSALNSGDNVKTYEIGTAGLKLMLQQETFKQPLCTARTTPRS